MSAYIEPNELERMLTKLMTKVHGPLLSGDFLFRSLGYSSSDALRQAFHRNTIPITLIDFPNRKNKFALSDVIAEWLVRQRFSNYDQPVTISKRLIEMLPDKLKILILDKGYLFHEEDILDFLGLKNKNELLIQYESGAIPFSLFTIDKRRTKLFALSIEVFDFMNKSE